MSTKINPTYEYDVTIIRWLDGDTVSVSISLGFDLMLDKCIRVYGINCREVHNKDATLKMQGLADKAFAEQLLPVGTKTVARTHKEGKEKFGRYLAELETVDGKDFATEMIVAGHAKPWDGQGVKPI